MPIRCPSKAIGFAEIERLIDSVAADVFVLARFMQILPPELCRKFAGVHHGNSVSKMVALGRDVERNVLSRGPGCHLEDRVIVHGNKTVVFA